jgi:hypothetical protein
MTLIFVNGLISWHVSKWKMISQLNEGDILFHTRKEEKIFSSEHHFERDD